MNPVLRKKLESSLSSYQDITTQLSSPEIYSDRTENEESKSRAQ